MRSSAPFSRAAADASGVEIAWARQIRLRDGVSLNATLYQPHEAPRQRPCIITMTPYSTQFWHDYGVYFASGGYSFLIVDVRGRGNSEGVFRPFIQEADDAYDVIEWAAIQDWCDGRVAMWGASYAGYVQWAAAARRPPSLRAIAPVAAPFIGVDMPMRSNIFGAYIMEWLTLVFGRTLQDRFFFNQQRFWNTRFSDFFRSGLPFRQLDAFLGMSSATFQEWLDHPLYDAFWASYNPTPEDYAAINVPILAITGIYDGDHQGTLAHYKHHSSNKHAGSPDHHLIIGPWDHFGTREPRLEMCGVRMGPASLVDIQEIHLDWYNWVFAQAERPAFLKDQVSVYVMGADEWRTAASLDALSNASQPLFLAASNPPLDVFHSGVLSPEAGQSSGPHRYVYDPRDTSNVALELECDPYDAADQSLAYAERRTRFIYHSPPLADAREIAGFFRLDAWISIEAADADFIASVYLVNPDGTAQMLTKDLLRARYRAGIEANDLIQTPAPQLYRFEHFNFVAIQAPKGSRLRLVLGSHHTIHAERNGGLGGNVADEAVGKAEPIGITIFHDPTMPSALFTPWQAQGAT